MSLYRYLILLPGSLLLSNAAFAQVVPDQTLPENSLVDFDSPGRIEINGGSIQGSNLFHSFESFSVPFDSTVFFNNPIDISNIFSRVTGSGISSIDGILGASGSANLFLINPNGIIFGENSALDIGGSFFATTGNIVFEDGSEFGSLGENASTLSIEVPLGAQLNGLPATEIAVEGQGNGLFTDPDFFDTNVSGRPPGLEVGEGQTLTFAAESVVLDGGNITAPDGTINLEGNSIILRNAASASARGFFGGEVNVNASSLEVLDGSAILADTEGGDFDTVGGDVNLNVNSLLVAGSGAEFPSFIGNDVAAFAGGNSGNINVNATEVILADGGIISNNSFDFGNSGDININAQSLEVSGIGLLPSAITAQVNFVGNSGNININAQEILVSDGGEITIVNFGEGLTGDINLNAETIEVSNFGQIFGGTVGLDVGDININSTELNINTQGRVELASFGDGNVGQININTEELNVNSDEFGVTGIFAVTEGFGSASEINVQAQEINLLDGGFIEATSFGDGNAADVNIQTGTLTASGFNQTEDFGIVAAGIRANSEVGSTGEAGNISINANTIALDDVAQIVSNTSSQANAGNITIETSSLSLDGAIAEGSTGILTTATESFGNGGIISIQAQEIEISDGATISASNFPTGESELLPGTGDPGLVLINGQSLNLESGGSISTATLEGSDGLIEVNVEDLNLNQGEISSSTSGSGTGGSISLNASEVNLLDSTITVTATGSGDAGEISIGTSDLNLTNSEIDAESVISGGGNISIISNDLEAINSQISTSVTDSSGGGGNLSLINENLVRLENSDLLAQAVFGSGGNIDVDTRFLFASPASLISASSQFGLDGNVEVEQLEPDVDEVANLSSEIDPTSLISASCPLQKDNSFANLGRGGILNSYSPIASLIAISESQSGSTISLSPSQMSLQARGAIFPGAASLYKSCAS